MVEAAIFIPLVIVAVTQMIKMAIPGIKSWVTVLLALVVGILIAVVDGAIGVTNITIAQGVVFALEAIGITAVAAKAGGGARGDNTSQ
jgi:hypothetical protein